MPREAYSDKRQYDDGYEERSRSRQDRYAEERREPGRRRGEERGSDVVRRQGDAGASRSQNRSRSPNFERDRTREREKYERRHRQGSQQEEGAGADPQRASLEPNFEPSGLLAKESNSKNGVALKYAEPAEARKPKKKWRLYVFKDGKEIDILHISRQSCYLLGRDRAVADIPIEHPSISKQHAVIQFRNIRERNEYGDEKQSTKPFLIDLDSANGCVVNGTEVPPSRFYEIKNGDTLKLGGSLREYVLLAED